jgi:hypothetical protein
MEMWKEVVVAEIAVAAWHFYSGTGNIRGVRTEI